MSENYPKIEWALKYMPGNRDILDVVAQVKLGNDEVIIVINRTRNDLLLFIVNAGDTYGVLQPGVDIS